MTPEDIAPEFRVKAKDYARATLIDGVKILSLTRFTDDRGFFMEVFRDRASHDGERPLVEFFQGARVAQMNYSIVEADGHIKGLHYHLKQEDIWFFPPPSKAKIVLYDIRKDSPTGGQTQVVVAGGGKDVVVRIPAGVAHGYRPLTNPCSLFYIVTQVFDPANPDEYRIAWDHPAVKDLWEIPNG